MGPFVSEELIHPCCLFLIWTLTIGAWVCPESAVNSDPLDSNPLGHWAHFHSVWLWYRKGFLTSGGLSMQQRLNERGCNGDWVQSYHQWESWWKLCPSGRNFPRVQWPNVAVKEMNFSCVASSCVWTPSLSLGTENPGAAGAWSAVPWCQWPPAMRLHGWFVMCNWLVVLLLHLLWLEKLAWWFFVLPSLTLKTSPDFQESLSWPEKSFLLLGSLTERRSNFALLPFCIQPRK